MNDTIKTLLERRSIRAFKKDLPPKALIEEVIKAGLYAPSARGLQDTIIIAVTNKDLRDKISKSNNAIMGGEEGADPFYGAPVILIVLADATLPNRVYDGSLVMGNLLNAAHSLGLGSIWIHRAREEFSTPEWKSFLKELGVEGSYEGVGHCALGYAASPLPTPAERKSGRVYWVE